MQALFSAELSHNQLTYRFIVVRVSDNLFQAKSTSEIIVLWKTHNIWEGVSNLGESELIPLIGEAIDKHFISSAIN